MATVGAGALPIAFGDFRAGYTIVERLGMSTLVDPYSAKPFVEFYSRRRVGGDVTNFEAIKLQKVAASRSEEHTSELQSLMRISYAVFCLKKKNKKTTKTIRHNKTQHKEPEITNDS